VRALAEMRPGRIPKGGCLVLTRLAGFTDADLSIEAKENKLAVCGEKQAGNGEKTGNLPPLHETCDYPVNLLQKRVSSRSSAAWLEVWAKIRVVATSASGAKAAVAHD
jgi:hypothetical protein